jgi:hypothetical protein
MPNYTPFNEESHSARKRLPTFIAKAKEFVHTLQANLKNEASGVSIAAIATKAEQMALRNQEQLKQAQALSVLIDNMYKERAGSRDIQEKRQKTHRSKIKYGESRHFQSAPKTREQKRALEPKGEKGSSNRHTLNR